MVDDSRIRDIVYKRRNGENIVNDPEAIVSCKNEQSRDVIDNARLGSYDKFGNYIIIPDIKRELLSMPKLVYNVKNQNNKTVYELKSTIPIFGDIFFKLTFSSAEAVLSLTETVNREANSYLEVYDEPLDSLGYGKDALPQEIVFRNYNVIENPEDFGKNIGANDFNSILTRKVYLSLLSKELRDISKFDEHEAFDKMVATLKNGGEYGARVLRDFIARLKERPGIFEINQTEKYNKAVNEVLLSSLDIVTTNEDKENYATKQTYLEVLNARNQNIQSFLEEANARVDEEYVSLIVNKATKNFIEENQEEQEDETIAEFFERIKDKKIVPTKRKLEKPILKQGKEEKKENKKESSAAKTKEEKIKSILEKKTKKTQSKKTPAGKKLKANKKAQKKGKKLKPKKSKSKKLKSAKKKVSSKGKVKKAKKKLGKGKVKSKKKKLKKAKSPQKAKAKVGTLKSSGGKKAGGAKKKKEVKKNVTIKMALVTPNNVSMQNVLPTYSIVSQVRDHAAQSEQEQSDIASNAYADKVAKIQLAPQQGVRLTDKIEQDVKSLDKTDSFKDEMWRRLGKTDSQNPPPPVYTEQGNSPPLVHPGPINTPPPVYPGPGDTPIPDLTQGK